MNVLFFSQFDLEVEFSRKINPSSVKKIVSENSRNTIALENPILGAVHFPLTQSHDPSDSSVGLS